MKAKEMRTTSAKELLNQLEKLQKQLGEAHIDYRTKEIKNVKLIATIKKDIARVKTVIHENSRLEGEKA